MPRYPADQIVVAPSLESDAEAMAALMALVYNAHAEGFEQIFSAEQFRHHIAIFPEGQFTAFHGDRIVGVTVSMRIDFDPAHPFIEPWWQTIGGGWLRHVPDGAWMYGVESNVDPAYQGRGVGGKLMEARFDTARLLNLRGMVAGSTLMSYGQHAAQVSPEEYVAGVIAGRFFDNNLSKQMIKGFRPLPGAVIPGYVSDISALGWGTVIVWDNPDYDAARGPQAHIAVQQQRVYRRAL